MKKINFLFSVSLICILFTGCTGLLYRKANVEYSNLQYYYAIKHYNKVIAKKDLHGAKIKLANSYRLMKEDAKAVIKDRNSTDKQKLEALITIFDLK